MMNVLLCLREEERRDVQSPGAVHRADPPHPGNFKHLWEQWTHRSNELLKGVGGRSRSTGGAPGNPEEVLDAVFDFAENLIAQQRAFAKQMLRATSSGQQTIADATTATATEAPTPASPASPASAASTPDTPSATAARGTRAKPTPAP